jgi:hypothetical protein
MATNELYPPRSAFGDTMLNLASKYVGDRGHGGDGMANLLPGSWFDASPWEHNKLDVIDWAALMVLAERPDLATQAGVPKKRLQTAFDGFRRANELLLELPRGLQAGPNICHLLDRYWFLGDELALVRAAEEELRALSPDHLGKVIEVLFSHPLWWVTESAASVLATIADESESARQLVESLLKSERWRVKLGAVEAAFDMRHLVAGDIYQQSVKASWNDKNPRIRGLCAENLIANILERRTDWSKRTQLVADNKEYLLRWFGDHDCWVLEHPYRMVQVFRAGLKARQIGNSSRVANEALDAIIDKAVARNGALLDKRVYWDKEDRPGFLKEIERLKRRA